MTPSAGADRPFVSFLTTAYQTEQYVGEMIGSVLAQTDGDWELVVVDNGCSDDMAAAVRPHTADGRITLLRQPNRGYVGGVRAAASAARGRYLCVLDSDDLLEPEFCARVRAVVDTDPGIDGVGCNATVFQDGGGGVEDFFASTGRRVVPAPTRAVPFADLLAQGAPPYVGLARREVWDELGGYDCPPDLEPDVMLWLRLVAAGHDLRILAEPLARTRVRPQSISHHPAKVDAFQRRLQQSYVTAAREHGFDAAAAERSGTVRRLRYHHSLTVARSALLEGDSRSARRAARDAWRQRRTVRAAVALSGTYVHPDVALPLRAAKNRIGDGLRRVRRRHAGSAR